MKTLLRAWLMVVVMTAITGIGYPLVITAIAYSTMPTKAHGLPELIGQPFSEPRYFWGRPSATVSMPYDAAASTGSNLGPVSNALTDAVRARVAALHDAGDEGPPPVDLVTASASGLDPHISPAAADYQAARVARVRGLSVEDVSHLIGAHTEDRTLGVLGEPRVNVLALNRALDAIH